MKSLLYIFIALTYKGPVGENPTDTKFNPDLIKFEKVQDLTYEQCQNKVAEYLGKFGTVFCVMQEDPPGSKKKGG